MVLNLTRLPPKFEQAFEQFISTPSNTRNISSFTSPVILVD